MSFVPFTLPLDKIEQNISIILDLSLREYVSTWSDVLVWAALPDIPLSP